MSSSEADIPPQKTVAGAGGRFFVVSFRRNIFEQILTMVSLLLVPFWDVFVPKLSSPGTAPTNSVRSAAFANHLSSQTSSGGARSVAQHFFKGQVRVFVRIFRNQSNGVGDFSITQLPT